MVEFAGARGAVVSQAIRRIVTGHDADGKGMVSDAGGLPLVVELSAVPGTIFHEVWATSDSPARIDNGPDPTTGVLALSPPVRGTRLRVVDIPPDSAAGAPSARAVFDQIGAWSASTAQPNSPHPLMHRTETVDYGVVLEGEITLILDASEVSLQAGDIVIQRGTNHAWANRSSKPVRMLFMLIDGSFEPMLRTVVSASCPIP